MPLRNSTSFLALLLGSLGMLGATPAYAQTGLAPAGVANRRGYRNGGCYRFAPLHPGLHHAHAGYLRKRSCHRRTRPRRDHRRAQSNAGIPPVGRKHPGHNGQFQRHERGGFARGLGVNRTLVLLDGQRFVPTNTNSSVDVDTIPVLLLSRVDTVTGGASAAYGSDAVGGVVNFIMRDRLEGVIGNVGLGISQQGDNLENDYNDRRRPQFLRRSAACGRQPRIRKECGCRQRICPRGRVWQPADSA